MNLEFTCASAGEKAQTIRTNQLTGFNFKFKQGDFYKITFSNGKTAVAYVNRKDASTFYIKSSDFPSGLKRASVGNSVSRTIKKISFYK